MKTFMGFPICSLLFMSLIAVVYFFRARLKSIENSIYKWLVIVNIIGLILEILCYFAVDMVDSYHFLSIAILKLYVVYIYVWANIFNSYVLIATYKNYDKKDETVLKFYQKVKIFSILTGIIGSLILLLLPIYIYNEGSLAYTYGPITNVLIAFCFIMVSFWFVECIVNIKNLRKKRYIPIIACIIVLTIVLIIQSYDRTILISTAGHAFMVLLMFFTIENPDVKMITELNKNRLLVNQANEEKSNFLFLTANQIKEPIKKIQELSHDSYDIKNVNDLQEVIKEINNLSHSLSYQVENVMDISSLTNSNIKMIENKYNLSNLIEKVRLQKEKNISSKVEFRVNISKNIPKYLYGDSKLLEQIISSVLNNAIKYTDEGFIEFNVNTITKYDMCRLMIDVADSGCGMSIDKVNDLLMLDEPLQEKEQSRLETGDVDINTIKKIVSKMGGYFTIKSEENRGSEVNIVIDQKMDMEGNIEFDKYLDKEKVLVASNDMSFLNSLTKLIREHGLEIETSIYANDVIDRIRVHEEFSYIFLDDSLDKRALEVLKELKKNPKFKAKVIVMLDKDTEFIKEHFIKDGFSDYLIKDNLLEEVNRILK